MVAGRTASAPPSTPSMRPSSSSSKRSRTACSSCPHSAPLSSGPLTILGDLEGEIAWASATARCDLPQPGGP
eukprot:scaffold75295_cov65-Phaeocystis_antarctica.AAC.5